MSVSVTSADDLHSMILKSNTAEILSCVNPRIQSRLAMLMDYKVGAYICQNPTSPAVCGANRANCYTIQDVVGYIEEAEDKVMACGLYHPEAVKGVSLYVMGQAHFRLAHRNTDIAVASLLKYYFVILAVRDFARTRSLGLDKIAAAQLNVDWLYEEDDMHTLFWENIVGRTAQAIKYVGCDLLPLPGDKENTIDDRLLDLSKTSEYKSYFTYVYSKSEHRNFCTLGWVVSKANQIIHAVVETRPDLKDKGTALTEAVDCCAPSMRTSTTGATLHNRFSVFAPKAVEGDRLLSNLFKYHMPSRTTGLTDLLELCEAQVQSERLRIEETTYTNRPPRVGGGGRRGQDRSM